MFPVPEEMTVFGRSSRPGKRNVRGCPGYLRLKLRWDDYYPALRTKNIAVRGLDSARQPLNTGRIRAEVLNPVPGTTLGNKVHLDVAEAAFQAGRAVLQVRVDPDVTPQDLESIEIKFTYYSETGEAKGSIQGT
jgi:hypothetical protein